MRAWVLLLFAGAIFAHGGSAPPPPPKPPPTAPPPGSPGKRTKRAKGPKTPGPRRPRSPSTKTPGEENRASWRKWWNYNREDLVGLRGRTRSAVTTSGPGRDSATPLGARREEVRTLLRRIASQDPKPGLRAAAMIALGRMGDDEDAYRFLCALQVVGQERRILEAAAIALAIVPSISDASVRRETRDWLTQTIHSSKALPSRAHGLCLLAAGMRAEHEPTLLMQFAGHVARGGFDHEEAGTLAFALGLAGDAMTTPELMRAVKRRKLGGVSLNDVGRANAVAGLARIGHPPACRLIAAVLRSRSAGEHARRSAALGLGRILIERAPDPGTVKTMTDALEKAIDSDADPHVRGFAAIALGAARTSTARKVLEHALRKSGRVEQRPFAAIGLGIWARRAGEAGRLPVQKVLVRQLRNAKNPELRGALCIACGLAEAVESKDALLAILGKSKDGVVRGDAAQGLGLLGLPDPVVFVALERVLTEGDRSRALPGAALALGLLGRRSAAGVLARGLRRTRSSVLQGRIILALGHLGHREAIDPLLALVRDRREPTVVREFAIVALGLMGDERARDPLFAADAWFNYYATTNATNEFLRIY